MSNPSSSVGHKKAGRKPSLLWLTPGQYESIKAAAKSCGEPVTQFLIRVGVAAALRKIGKKKE